MKEFKGRLAVVTGCGSGIGRELTRQLAAAGVRVAGCDLMAEALQETVDLVKREFPHARVTGHSCDVGMEGDIAKFREDVASSHDAECVHLLFNNAA
ncbi:MAG: SDR family NAD(P)-dependent oxidoreductase, partial [Pseudomonadales bacterium]|nr:SDR family NAD(P)-dependent oxidoreductase [Pseudomonadales bacterium]